MTKAVVFDVGQTLIDESRYWASWADWLGVPRHTMAVLVGALVGQGRDDTDALRLIRPGIDPEAEAAAREAAGRGEYLDETDLFPDVRPALAALRGLGLRVCVAGNQTARAARLLRAMDLPVDAVAVSAEWGVAKPAPEFFARVVELAGERPDEIVYVGDYPAKDIVPAKAAGLRTAFLRRGPWALLWGDAPEAVAAADWRIDTLTELVALVR